MTGLRQVYASNVNTAQGTVTYTGAGTCVIDGNAPASPYGYTVAPQVQQTSTVPGKPQAISFTSTDPAHTRPTGAATT